MPPGDPLKQPCAFKLVYNPDDHTVNDHCLIKDDSGTWHLFYIYFPRDDRRSSAGLLEYGIGHATSRDLVRWQESGICLQEDPGTWEGDAIYAPNVHRTPDGNYVMLYCGSRDGAQQMGAASSDDLVTWRKHPGNPVITPPASWSGWEGSGDRCCRDAHLLKVEPGRFLCYYTADDIAGGMVERDGQQVVARCCIAAAASRDLLHWKDLGPVCRADKNWKGPGQTMMESPGVTARTESGQTVHTLHFTHRFGVSYVQSNDALRFDGPPRLLGPWHASEIFRDNDTHRWFITSCLQRAGSISIPDDVLPGTEIQEDVGLMLAGLVWIEGLPVVADLERHLSAGSASEWCGAPVV